MTEANIAEAELAKAMTPLEQANALLKANERKLCAPGDDQESHFFLRFNDPDQRELYFSEEAEARAAWNSYCGPSGHWNGYLFGVVSREPTTAIASALLEKHKALEEALGLFQTIASLVVAPTDYAEHNARSLLIATDAARAFLARQGETASKDPADV